MGKLKKNIKIYMELYGPLTLDLIHAFAESTGKPINSKSLETVLTKDKEIINLGYVQKNELANTNLDAIVAFGDNYLVSNWFLHPYYFSKQKKTFSRNAAQVYHAAGLDKLLKD